MKDIGLPINILIIILILLVVCSPVYALSFQDVTNFFSSFFNSIASFFGSAFSVLTPSTTVSGGGGGGGSPSGPSSCSGSLSLVSSGKDTCTITATFTTSYCDNKSYEIKNGGSKCSGKISGNSSTSTCSWQVTYGTYTYSLYLDSVLKSSSSVTCAQSSPTCTPSCNSCGQSSSTSCTGTQTCTKSDCSAYTQSCNVNSGASCKATQYGSCILSSGQCGTGSQSVTSYACNGAGSCTSSVSSQSCVVNCPSGQNCNTTTKTCYIPVASNCSDGTLYSQCSSTKPKYCSSGTLINKCSLCNCSTSQICNTTIETCYTPSTSNFSITAASGSPADIQAAVNTAAAAGGGTVYIPAGNWTFNPPSGGVGVTIPWTGNITLMGAGIGQTILTETTNPGSGTMIKYDGQSGSSQGAPVRISGISFMGMVVSEASTQNTGIQIRHAKDYRIDHCAFNNFESTAIGVDDNLGYNSNGAIICRGVIDHCTFDNTYKIGTSMSTLWGYGIIVVGDYYTWDPTVSHLLGYYYPSGTYTFGYDESGTTTTPMPLPTYIENCNFTRNRHAIASNGGGMYVVRYCYFQMPAPYRPVDIHGDSGNANAPWGGRYLEAYGNTFDLTDQTYTNGDCAAFGIRGGGGVIWNNTIIVPSTSSKLGMEFGNDGESAPYDVESLYWWNNIVETSSGTQLPSSTYINMNGQSYTQNVNYFLRAPDQASDGFTYTPYTYPHPLTAD